MRPAVALTLSVAALLAAATSGSAQQAAGRHLAEKTHLEEMIGQMIMIGQRGEDPTGKWRRRAARLVRDGRVGGVKLAAQSVDPAQLRRFTSALHPRSGLPPFIGIERAAPAPAEGPLAIPCARDVGKLDQLSAYRLYRKSAIQLAELGINLSFGPALDVDPNSSGSTGEGLCRSYGGDPQKIIAFSRQFIDAYGQAAILAAAKNFPGDASSGELPRRGKLDADQSWRESELEPFRDLIGDEFVGVIMVSHLVHPRFSDGDRPASLSRRALAGVLRSELGFRGLILTDDLSQHTIARRYAVDEAAVLAVAAGADVVLVTTSARRQAAVADRITSAIIDAVADGRIPRRSIEDAYVRITNAKRQIEERRGPRRSINIAGKMN